MLRRSPLAGIWLTLDSDDGMMRARG